jgi:hypothetical protein
VYDAKQAARGAELYTRACAACHGQDLEGIEQAPPLAGGTFGQRWDGSALKKLIERIEEMPPDDPNKRLSDQQNVDVLAFLLSSNKIPAGAAALAADRNGLAQITFLATKPKYDTESRFLGAGCEIGGQVGDREQGRPAWREADSRFKRFAASTKWGCSRAGPARLLISQRTLRRF